MFLDSKQCRRAGRKGEISILPWPFLCLFCRFQGARISKSDRRAADKKELEANRAWHRYKRPLFLSCVLLSVTSRAGWSSRLSDFFFPFFFCATPNNSPCRREFALHALPSRCEPFFFFLPWLRFAVKHASSFRPVPVFCVGALSHLEVRSYSAEHETPIREEPMHARAAPPSWVRLPCLLSCLLPPLGLRFGARPLLQKSNLAAARL